jgi:hypothetical protein
MSLRQKVLTACALWIGAITLLHCWLNLGLFEPHRRSGEPFRVGFLPVT